jgi:ABC-type glycerol-3-phosphate transport system permease component
MAGSVLLTAPVMLMFFFVQRYFWPEGRLAGSK